MIVIENAPYIYDGDLVYIYDLDLSTNTAKILRLNNGSESVSISLLKPAFSVPEYKWDIEELFIDVKTPIVCNNGKDIIDWDHWIKYVYNPHNATSRLTSTLPFGVYKNVFYTMPFLKEKICEYVDLLSRGK